MFSLVLTLGGQQDNGSCTKTCKGGRKSQGEAITKDKDEVLSMQWVYVCRLHQTKIHPPEHPGLHRTKCTTMLMCHQAHLHRLLIRTGRGAGWFRCTGENQPRSCWGSVETVRACGKRRERGVAGDLWNRGVCGDVCVWCELMTAERRSNHQEALQYVFHLSCKDSAKTMDMTLEVCDTRSITDTMWRKWNLLRVQ